MPTVNIMDIPEWESVKLVDLSDGSVNKVADAVDKKLTAEPVERKYTVKLVRHGRWIYKEAYKDAGFGFYKCTECGEPFWFNNMNYCPNCGAKMDEVENG